MLEKRDLSMTTMTTSISKKIQIGRRWGIGGRGWRIGVRFQVSGFKGEVNGRQWDSRFEIVDRRCEIANRRSQIEYPSYSSLSVLAGSSPAARRAGPKHAITAVPSIPSETIANVAASVAPTSNNSADM